MTRVTVGVDFHLTADEGRNLAPLRDIIAEDVPARSQRVPLTATYPRCAIVTAVDVVHATMLLASAGAGYSTV